MKKIKQIIKTIWAKGALHIFMGSFLNKFVAFFGSIVIVRLLSKTEYGMLGYAENLYNFAYIIAGFGVSNAILRYVVLEDSIEEKKNVFLFSSRFAFKFNIILVVLLGIINTFYPHTSEFEACRIYIYIMILSLPFQYYTDNSLSLERAMFNNKKYALLAFMTSAMIIVGKLLGASINGLMGVIVLGVIINIILAYSMLQVSEKKYFIGNSKYFLEKNKKKKILSYSFQYMLTNGIWTLFMLIDVFMLGKIADNSSIIADYKVAYAWPANISIICSAIGVFIAPYFIKNEKNPDWIRLNYKRTFLISFFLVCSVGLVMILLAKPLIFIYGGSLYYNVIPVMQVLTIGSIINNGLRYTTANIFAAMGKIKYNMFVSALGIIVQSVLNLYMIPRFGMYGPAFSGIINYSLMAIILFVCFAKTNDLFGQKKP